MYVHETVLDMPFNEVSDAFFRFGREVLRVFSIDEALTRTGFEKTVQDIYGRTFSCAVFPQKPHDMAFGNDDIQVFVNEFLAVVVCNVSTFDDGTFFVHIFRIRCFYYRAVKNTPRPGSRSMYSAYLRPVTVS